MMIRILFVSVLMTLCTTLSLRAEELLPKNITWTAQDTTGKTFTVPVAKRVTVLLFVMAEQDHSQHAMGYAQQVLADRPEVQIAAVLSGEQAASSAPALMKKTKWTMPLVADQKYEASGQMLVRVWPTTLVIAGDGKLLAHIGGSPASYSKDLAAYLDFALGKIDATTLQQRLADRGIVGSTQDDIANRHLQLAQRLMEKGDFTEARLEIARGLEKEPGAPMLRLALARLDIATGQPAQALNTLKDLDEKSVAPWRISALRGRAMVALGQWDDARKVLKEALTLNPEPAEVHYALGLVYQHDKDWQQSAQSFRLAFESSSLGRTLSIPAPQQK